MTNPKPGTINPTMGRVSRAKRARRLALATLTTMVKDGVVYQHNPATVGHARHSAECWTVVQGPGA